MLDLQKQSCYQEIQNEDKELSIGAGVQALAVQKRATCPVMHSQYDNRLGKERSSFACLCETAGHFEVIHPQHNSASSRSLANMPLQILFRNSLPPWSTFNPQQRYPRNIF
jgi:hypothetical protein